MCVDSEARARELRREKETEPAPLFKMDKFKDVPSRVFEEKHSSPPAEGREREERRFLERGVSEKRIEDLAHQRRVQRETSELESKLTLASPRKAPVPRSSEVAPLAAKREVNFVGKNRVRAQVLQPPVRGARDKEASGRPAVHASFGRVPDYLEQRNSEWAEEKERQRRAAPDPDCPPGMRLMGEDEREQTLAKLAASHSEVLRQLQAMPFVIETQSQKSRQSALESRLCEIEDAVAVFRRPRVYVAL